MTIKHFFIFPLIFFALFLVSCSDDPSSIGAGLLTADQINIERIDSFTDSIPQTSASIMTHVPLGSSNRLMIGRYQNVEASFLIRFAFAFPDSIKQQLLADSLSVKSAKIALTRVYTFGDNTNPLDIVIQGVTSPWSSVGFISDSLPNLQTTSIQIDSLAITDSVTTFKIDNQTALNWLKFTADPALGSNWGLYLKPGTAAAKIYGYQALISAAEDVPTIQLIIEKPGVYTDTLSFIPSSDISVLDSIAPYPTGEYITVQSGLRIMSYLKFNIDSVPAFAIINKAELILTSDTTLNLTGDASNKVVGYIPKDTINLDTIGSATIEFVKDRNLFKGDITSLVQDWLVTRNNRGLVITTSNELNGLERFVFRGSDAIDPALRPRLIITYTNKL